MKVRQTEAGKAAQLAEAYEKRQKVERARYEREQAVQRKKEEAIGSARADGEIEKILATLFEVAGHGGKREHWIYVLAGRHEPHWASDQDMGYANRLAQLLKEKGFAAEVEKSKGGCSLTAYEHQDELTIHVKW